MGPAEYSIASLAETASHAATMELPNGAMAGSEQYCPEEHSRTAATGYRRLT
jgi:hypothetical protein